MPRKRTILLLTDGAGRARTIGTDLDVLIACHRLTRQTPEFRAKIRGLINKSAAKLRKEMAEDPSDAAAYNQFAWLVGNTEGDLDEALRCSQKSIQLKPDSGGYHDTLAHVYFARGEYEKAVATQTKAIQLEPHSGIIRLVWIAARRQASTIPGPQGRIRPTSMDRSPPRLSACTAMAFRPGRRVSIASGRMRTDR